MPKPNSGQPLPGETAIGNDLHQILGDMDDNTALAILALHPSIVQIEEARVWLNGAGDILGKECPMQITTGSEWTMVGPKRRERHYSYDEGVDEPAKLIEDEPVEIEKEIPADENQPVERIEENNRSDPPAFEE